MKTSVPSSSHFKIHQYVYLELFWLVNSAWSEHISLLIQSTLFFDFLLEKAIVENSYFSQKQLFEVKNILIMDLFITNMLVFAT